MIWDNDYGDVATGQEVIHWEYNHLFAHVSVPRRRAGNTPSIPYFFASLGLKKLVNLDIDDVFTFLSASTPREAGGAFRFVPALAPSLDGLTMGADAAAATAARLARCSERAEKLYVASERLQEHGHDWLTRMTPAKRRRWGEGAIGRGVRRKLGSSPLHRSVHESGRSSPKRSLRTLDVGHRTSDVGRTFQQLRICLCG